MLPPNEETESGSTTTTMVNDPENHHYVRPGRIIPVYGPVKVGKKAWKYNAAGAQWFQCRDGYFIFNEGGQGLTLTIYPKWCPFRLYVAGWVLMYRKRWSLTRWKDAHR